jgi:hypothetical protein
MSLQHSDGEYVSPEHLVALVAEQAKEIGKLSERLSSTRSKLEKVSTHNRCYLLLMCIGM